MAQMRYEVLVEGWPDGQLRKAGAEIAMDEEAARYLVLNGQLRAVPAPAPASAKAAAGKPAIASATAGKPAKSDPPAKKDK